MTNKNEKQFNKYERIAGIYILLCTIGLLVLVTAVVVEKGWFESKVAYTTYLSNAKDIHKGTDIMASGIRVGWVSNVDIVGAKKVRVDLNIFEKHASLITQGSEVAVVRAYLVGDKFLELLLGEVTGQTLPVGSEIASRNSVDLLDFVSSKDLALGLSDAMNAIVHAEQVIKPSLEKVNLLSETIRHKIESVDGEKMDAIVNDVLKRSNELSTNMSDMGRELAKVAVMLNKHQRLQGLLDQSHDLVLDLNHRVPALTDRSQVFMDDMTRVAQSLEATTKEFEKLVPIAEQISPELPELTEKTLTALEESVVLMRAMQKSFLLRKHVEHPTHPNK